MPWLPGLRTVGFYQSEWLRRDLAAGLVMTTRLIPIVDSRHDNCDVPDAPKRPVRCAPRWFGWTRDEYAVGDHRKFEIRIENVGRATVVMPFSLHLADLQPLDGSQKFGYSVVRLEFELSGHLFKAERSLTYL